MANLQFHCYYIYLDQVNKLNLELSDKKNYLKDYQNNSKYKNTVIKKTWKPFNTVPKKVTD